MNALKIDIDNDFVLDNLSRNDSIITATATA